ncbi:hypothetical protein [Streptomyces sp. NRRL S-237]|uniref:hypothetical protein n=1 Tax=Streptomyces sp. NRRL S-237 TaxID=1463895 RepID=UPI0004C6274E|nr:hypothetical protein [Streptomyces sp. NRRL S-237]
MSGLSTVFDWIADAWPAIPTAALTTVGLGAWLAPWIARRQERGKLQAAAEAELRTAMARMRADVAYAGRALEVTSVYDPQVFAGPRLIDFTSTVVGSARSLPRKQQSALRAALVDLVGDWRVRLAEDVGPNWLARAPKEEDDTLPTPADFRSREGLLLAAARQGAGTVRQDAELHVGLLGMMEVSKNPAVENAQALASLDRMLTIVRGGHRLGS